MVSEFFGEKPENKALVTLLLDFNQNQTKDKYAGILKSLQNDNHLFFLPATHDHAEEGKWTKLKEGERLGLNCIFHMEGLKLLTVFTSESSMTSWAKRVVQYIALSPNDVFNICQAEGIDRLIIDCNQPTEFFIARNQQRERTVGLENIEFIVFPEHALIDFAIANLAAHFLQLDFILEAFQYSLSNSPEPSVIIGIKLSEYNPHSIDASCVAVKEAFEMIRTTVPVDVFFLNDVTWYERVRAVRNSMFYKRPADR